MSDMDCMGEAHAHVELQSTSSATAAVVRTQHVTYTLVTGGSCRVSKSASAKKIFTHRVEQRATVCTMEVFCASKKLGYLLVPVLYSLRRNTEVLCADHRTSLVA